MLCGGQASCGFRCVGDAWDSEDHGVRGVFEAKAAGGFYAALAKGARKPQDSGECADRGLLRFGEFGKAVFLLWFRAPVVTDYPSHQVPLVGGPVWRDWEAL